MTRVFVSDSFDDLRSRQVRFLEEAARLGPVWVLLWSDAVTQSVDGKRPKFSQAEREYFLNAIRYVEQVILVDELVSPDLLPLSLFDTGATWAVPSDTDHQAKSVFCQANGLEYKIIPDNLLEQFPGQPVSEAKPSNGQKKVVVTGCYDWLHTGHVRFFEEAAQLGELYVVIGSDENVRLLKGEGHPLFGEVERRYMVQAVRYVTETWVSTGTGWMDAEPEITRIRPDCYVVNEDGDRPEKRSFCQARGLEYVVLKRLPKEGLPRRESTQLRGF
jgi:cytidyltransferase-like protein